MTATTTTDAQDRLAEFVTRIMIDAASPGRGIPEVHFVAVSDEDKIVAPPSALVVAAEKHPGLLSSLLSKTKAMDHASGAPTIVERSDKTPHIVVRRGDAIVFKIESRPTASVEDKMALYYELATRARRYPRGDARIEWTARAREVILCEARDEAARRQK